jgi:CheY-like chemotaxis protein
LIEDDPDQREIYEQLLYYNGFDVHSAPDGETGVTLAREHKPDAILADVILPRMTGLEAASILQQDPRTSHIPIICLSAHDVSVRRAHEAGAVEMLRKPVDGATLVRVIRRYIGWEDVPTVSPDC